MNKSTTRASLFELNGVPDLKQATPLAFQHVVGNDRRLCYTADHCLRRSRTLRTGFDHPDPGSPCHVRTVYTVTIVSFYPEPVL